MKTGSFECSKQFGYEAASIMFMISSSPVRHERTGRSSFAQVAMRSTVWRFRRIDTVGRPTHSGEPPPRCSSRNY
jgi:hypothetical protein